MVLNGEGGLEYEVHIDGVRLEHAFEFKYLWCVLDESGTDGAEGSKKVASGKRVAVAISSLVNAIDLQLKLARLMYDSENMLWKEKERSRVRAVQMDNLKGLLCIRRIYRNPNAWIREFCGMRKGLDERIDSAMWRGWRGIGSPKESM